MPENLVLLHGFSGTRRAWDGVIERLDPERYLPLALDLPGHGEAVDAERPITFEGCAEAVLAEAPERFALCGYSMGGRVALALTLAHPALVRSLVLVSTFASPPRRSWSRWVLLRVVPRVFGQYGSRAYPQPYYAFQRQREASGSYDCSRRLGEIAVPTLILHGTRDRVAPFRLAQEMHAGIRGSRLVPFPGGHIFFFLRMRQFVETVLGFLATV